MLSAVIAGLIAVKLYIKATTGVCRCVTRLDGKTAIVTGGNTGIGFEAAKEFAHRGARVIIASRNLEKCNIARETIVRETGNEDVAVKIVDFASFKSVREFAADVLKTESRIDILVNNAGAAILGNQKSEDGLQLALQINHFGPFLLTNLLLERIRESAPSRIIMVSAWGHKFAEIDFDDINMEKKWRDTLAYCNSKMCNIVTANEITRRLKGLGVTANSLHPGVVQTDIFRNIPAILRVPLHGILNLFCKSAYEGAQTIVFLAVSPEVENVSGEYFVDCKRATMAPLARDEEFGRRIWEMSEKCVNLQPGEKKYIVQSRTL